MSTETEKIGFALLIFGACVLGWQVYEFLRYDFWTPVSVITALEWMKVGWAINPTDWVGLYNIFGKIPLSLVMVVVGFVVIMT